MNLDPIKSAAGRGHYDNPLPFRLNLGGAEREAWILEERASWVRLRADLDAALETGDLSPRLRDIAWEKAHDLAQPLAWGVTREGRVRKEREREERELVATFYREFIVVAREAAAPQKASP